MKGQISTEYLIVVGFALLLTIPTVIVFFTESSKNVAEVNTIQAKQIARKIVDNAEEVYYLGAPSTTTIKVIMPQGIQNITIKNRYILITLNGAGQTPNQVLEQSLVNITGNLTPGSGMHTIRIENLGDRVNISYSS